MQAESSLLKSVINDLPERCAEVLRCKLAPLLCMELKCTGQKGLSGRDSQLICCRSRPGHRVIDRSRI